MSLTPISQYASTISSTPRIAVRAPAPAPAPVKHAVQALPSGQVVESNGRSEGQTSVAKSSLNVEYDRLSRQTDIGPGANNNPSMQSFLASYAENSSGEANSQSLGTLFRSSA